MAYFGSSDKKKDEFRCSMDSNPGPVLPTNEVGDPDEQLKKDLAGASPDSKSRRWGKKTKIGVAVGAVLLVLAVVLGAVLGTRAARANRYPDYFKVKYTLKDTYEGESFFDDFDYFTGKDPTAGFVVYQNQSGSQALGLTNATSSGAILKVDTSENNVTEGRKSARISSRNTYDSGLFLFDILHSPVGCGTWSAVWLTDPLNWPNNGEIDVVEAVNTGNQGNIMSLHTSEDCSVNVLRQQTGDVLTMDCWNATDENTGCRVQSRPDTYGQGFNANSGGIYALEYRNEGIRTWFFPRSTIPSDISNGSSPDPSSWGTALADFPSTDCDIASHFKNQSIVVNIDLCGYWAGQPAVYGDQFNCPGTCSEYVANNSAAFKSAYWEFNSIKVYQSS